MTSVRELLAERSHELLLEWLRFPPNSGALGEGAPRAEREMAFEMAGIAQGQLNALLKATIDAADSHTFQSVLQQWRLAIRDDHLWQTNAYPTPADSAALIIEQDRLVLGLVMWTAHALARSEQGDRQSALQRTLSAALNWFTDRDQLEAAYEAAMTRDEPWTTWFLEELPSNDAHFIPTREELRRAAVLVCLRQDPMTPESIPFPDHLLRYQRADLERDLARIGEDAPRWTPVVDRVQEPSEVEQSLQIPRSETLEVGEPVFEVRVRTTRVASLLPRAQDGAERRYEQHVRDAPISAEKLRNFKDNVLDGSRKERIVADLLARAGAVDRRTSGAPAEPLHARQWFPKDWFIEDSNVMGLDMTARDLARTARHEEFRQLLAALGEFAPTSSGADVRDAALREIRRLRQRGSKFVLLLTPSDRRLRLALSPPTTDPPAQVAAWFPDSFGQSFAGLVDPETPILSDGEVPSDRFFVIDLARAVRLIEWPSDADSGTDFEWQSFTAASATRFLGEHPEARASGQTVGDATRTLEERVLIDLTLKWQITAGTERVVTALTVPRSVRS